MLALAMTGGAALAAALAVRRHTRGLEAVQRKTELHTWESEGGSPVWPAVGNPPSASAASAGQEPTLEGRASETRGTGTRQD